MMVSRRELSRRINDFDDGGTPQWREAHARITLGSRLRRVWRQASPLQLFFAVWVGAFTAVLALIAAWFVWVLLINP